MIALETFSQRLRAEREARGYTQAQFAALLGISRSTYKNYELLGTVDGRKPRLKMVVKIAKLLEVRTDYLFGLEE